MKRPHLIVGDFDSIELETKEYFAEEVGLHQPPLIDLQLQKEFCFADSSQTSATKLVHMADQDTTDLESFSFVSLKLSNVF